MQKLTYSVLAIVILIGCTVCKEPVEDYPHFAWQELQLPQHFPAPFQKLSDNPITEEGFILGRTLFYDPILSRDNTISCGSCHIQASAFTHHGHDISHGIDDKLGTRNAPAVQNMLWQKNFFWDGGVHNIELISINPIENPVEMDLAFDSAIARLQNHAHYPMLFKNAFGDEKVTGIATLNALGQFMRMLVSANSKYDRFILGKEIFTETEKEGLEIFRAKCNACHAEPLFTNNTFSNNGVYKKFPFDKGRYTISQLPEDEGKFKVPSLRNISYTAPYMHNGQFTSLDAVLDHYTNGISQHPTLDTLLVQDGTYGITISEYEKIKLKAFLETLNDEHFIQNTLFKQQ